MGKFNLAEAMQLNMSKLDIETKIEQIALDLIDPNPENFFTVEDDITDLAESIALNGLQQPLVITPADNGRYRVIAGHRRRKALLQLAENDPEKWRTAPCIIQHPATPEAEMLMLIQTNTESRELNWNERTKAAEKVEAILVQMQKEQGITLPGKMRERVAKIIKTSESQLARAQFIKKHLIPAAKKMGRSDDVCYKLAHLPKEDQEALCEHYKGQSWKLDGPAIKKYQDNVKAGRDPFHVTPPVEMCYLTGNAKKCDYVDFLEDREGCTDCCQRCEKKIDCPDVCSPVAEFMEERKQAPDYLIGQRIRATRIEGDLDVNAVLAALDLDWRDIKDIEEGYCIFSVRGIAEFCKLSGKSADWLLGLTDEDKPAAAPAAPDGWIAYPDTKPETGQLCEVLITDGIDPGNGKKVCDIWAARWTDDGFRSALSGMQSRRREIAWRPLPELPEGYSFSIKKEEQ